MGKKILLVDDVQLSIEMEKVSLERAGCRILTAKNGKEALEIIRKEHPDLVIMDLYMPEMNGDECCRQVKRDAQIKGTPIIMTTSGGSPEERKRCFDAGSDDFIVKPFKGAELFRKVERIIDITVRRHLRSPMSCAVSLYSKGTEYKGRSVDISCGGIFIESKDIIPKGSTVELKFRLPNSRVEIEAEGKVVRLVKETLNYESGMGIEFDKLSSDGEQEIIAYTHAGLGLGQDR